MECVSACYLGGRANLNVGALVNDGQFRMSAVRCYDTAMNQQNEKKCCSQSGAESVETPGVWVKTTWRWERKSSDAGKVFASEHQHKLCEIG